MISPTFASALHIAFDAPTVELLRHLGASSVIRASDCLLIGPSHRDPAQHLQVRQAFWHSSEDWDRLYAPDIAWTAPVVVWVSSNLNERLHLWRTCGYLSHRGMSAQDIWIVELPSLAPSMLNTVFPVDCGASVAHHSGETLLARLTETHPWPHERFQLASELWELFTDANPLPLLQRCQQGADGFPELASLRTFLSCFYPRKTDEGAFQLSRFDELLLSLLSDEWQTPLSLVAQESPAGEELRAMLCCTGDLFLVRRLEQWSVHGGAVAAVERAPGPKPDDFPLLCSVYRLSAEGLKLREGRLDRLDRAPPLPIGGACGYAFPLA